MVRLSIDSTNAQHEKLIFELVKPYIEGFSVSTKEEKVEEGKSTKNKAEKSKRKSTESATENKSKRKAPK
jgi:exosome complex exonuclease DIS3/RRP44